MSSYNKLFIDKRLPFSKAFLSIEKASTIQVLLIFYSKRRMEKTGRTGKEQYYITNNGELVFTFVEARDKYNIAPGRFGRAIDELLAHGFLEITKTGMGLHKIPTLFALSDRWLDYGKPNFEPAKRPQPMLYNAGFKKGNQLWKRRRKKNITAIHEHSLVFTHEHRNTTSGILVMFTDKHGKKVQTLYKKRGDKWLAEKSA